MLCVDKSGNWETKKIVMKRSGKPNSNGRTSMRLAPHVAPTSLVLITLGITSFFLLLNPRRNPFSPRSISSGPMARRSFIVWLHGLGDSGPANEQPIKTLFTSPEFNHTKWSFPSAPFSPVTCNYGAVMTSWFDIHEMPVTAHSSVDEDGVLKAVKNVHAMINTEIASGTNPDNIFVCGFSQGGALALASVLLYPKTLGGGAVLSGWVPFNESFIEKLPDDARKTPILWLHGMADRTVLFEAGQAGPPFLQKVGARFEFKAYPGLSHTMNNQELQYLQSWIKSRVKCSS